ncbi:hypothetical protein Leryth_015599 [Lithospermum erythrorhizon]|nr:hypothetical protein Leryth_015599 [Lithospermum erythrorhizon]
MPSKLPKLVMIFIFFTTSANAWRPWANQMFEGSKRFEGSSELVDMKYHMGPVLTENITIYPIWYGKWGKSQKMIIRDFINSISAVNNKAPSVSGWWKTVQLYTDQTGANISRNVFLEGKSLTRLTVQKVIKNAVNSRSKPLPINPKAGVYLLLTSDDVYVQDFCQGACGFHYFTFPSVVGYTLPYAWIGNSAKLCPGVCAYPFAVPNFMPKLRSVKSPNDDVGIDGMISVIAHELAEVATNPLDNAWFAGPDPVFPVEIADLCEGIYGTGGGGSYTGQMLNGVDGATYNMHGIRRRFLVQWVWNHMVNYCTGPNALDQ